MMASPTTIRSFSDRRTSVVTEHFKIFSASLGQVSETCLKKSRWMGVGKPDISTAISTSGWLITRKSTEVRLHRLEDTAKAKKFNVGEEVRAVAVSEDLLAIVTHTRLLVYEYREDGDLADFKVEERRIDQDGYWTPKSVAVLQAGDKRTEGGALAWIAVGGEGENGVKVFSYAFKNCWNTLSDRLILGCPYNNGAVKLVGFSPCRSNGIFGVLAFAVTTENQIYCWNITGRRRSTIQTVDSLWRLDCNVGRNESPHQGAISSANIFLSPTGRPYLFCTIDRKPGSQLLRSFIVPIDEFGYGPRPSREQIRELPDTVAGDNVLAGFASLNGHFLVTVEPGKMRLLTLKGAYEGGLTVLSQTVDWHSSLKGATADVSGISISVKEYYGGLEIVAVDGRRNIVTTRISVPNMPAPEKYVSILGRRSVVELPPHAAIRELSSDESSRHSVSTATENLEDRIELVAG